MTKQTPDTETKRADELAPGDRTPTGVVSSTRSMGDRYHTWTRIWYEGVGTPRDVSSGAVYEVAATTPVTASKTREARADQVRVGDQVRGRGEVSRVAAAGRWTRLWFGTRTNYDYRGDTILEVEIREGGFDGVPRRAGHGDSGVEVIPV